MEKISNLEWEEVFDIWRNNEAQNPEWIDCATIIKGYKDWESWRRDTAKEFNAENRIWEQYQFSNPQIEIPQMLIGPFPSWQNKFKDKNTKTFEDLLVQEDTYNHFSKNPKITQIVTNLPFPTKLIGLIRSDVNKIVCIEGHHRATAITLAKLQGQKIDYNNTPITIALSSLRNDEIHFLDNILTKASIKKQN